MNNLHCGGAEKALISLLQTIDYNHYEVDLYLFKKEGLFLNQVPKEVTILDQPKLYPYFDMSIKTAIIENLKHFRWTVIWNRIQVARIFKTEKRAAVREQKAWNYIKKCIAPLEKKYDVAIGYLQNTPNFFCMDKVEAKRKIAWIHTDYQQAKMQSAIDRPYFAKFDSIVTVSDECKQVLIEEFPEFESKIKVMRNIVSSDLILKLSKEPIEDLLGETTFLTIGRLVHIKGYDLVVNAARILVEKGLVNFKWYILGEGPMRNELNQMITEFKLQDHFVFLGLKENPYPYIKHVDLVVQSSRYEGKSIAIDEAKILCKPIVVTNFPTAKDQILNDENGVICEIDAQSIANAMERMLNDNELRNQCVENLKKGNFGSEDEIQVLYQIITN
jgi:glycosyltransferase involved in cell wall biosynthesis